MKKNVLEYLECTARKYPSKKAVADPDTGFTYQEYMETARKVGAFFTKYRVQGKPMAVVADKSTFVLAAMLGVVYAGGFYVYIDPSQPVVRFEKILHELQPVCVLIQEKYENVLDATDYTGDRCRLKDLSEACAEGITSKEEEILTKIREAAKSEDILYGVFTSGSSGTPKCVAVSHGAVVDFISHFTRTFQITEEDILANQAPFDFDVSVKDIYSALMTGAELLLIPREYFSTPAILLDYICDNRVTNLTWAVSALCLISGMKGLEYRIPETVKRIMFSGEVMPVLHLAKWQEALPEALFVNLYGPSEITCNCLYHVIDRKYEKKDTAKIPVGIPFEGREIFLIGEDAEIITEKNRNGELFVTGESLANGYYHNPEQTKEKFLEVLVDGKPRRAYRTGDLAYYGEDGLLYFAGRKDFQIKHMGHRIELEEIDRAIMETPGVTRCCTLFDTDKNRLAAFYTGEAGSADVRAFLKTRLPGYMVPSRILQMEDLPLNKNGKLDRNQLMERLKAGRK